MALVRRLVFVAILAILCVVCFRAGQANAWTRNPTISAIASVFAMRGVSVRCYGRDESNSPADYGAWGYVKKPLGRARYAAVDDSLCDAALHVNDPAYDTFHRALGVLVIVHESYHLRNWGGAGSEGKVECQAIRHWKVAARMFGATNETLDLLFPTALALHSEETRIVDWNTGERPYDDPTCSIPSIQP
jgi:hypothetical protein